MKNYFWIGYSVIVVLSSICYFPSIAHIPRADHIAYLAEIAPNKDFYSLAIRSADIPRTRMFIPGDQFLFRPVLFSFLGIEKYCFGYHFMYWQLTGILLHLIVLFFLLKLLLNVRPSIFAFALTAFFSVLFIPMEMVIWEQINGYMIFLISILIVLDQTFSYIDRHDEKFWRLLVIFTGLLVACFTYETANLLALLILIYFWMNASQAPQKLDPRLMIISPVLVYILCDAWDWCSHQYMAINPAQVPGRGDFIQFVWLSLSNGCIGNFLWFSMGLIPAQLGFQLENGSRSILTLGRSFHPLNYLSIVLVILLFFIPKAKIKNFSLFKWNFSTLLFAVFFVYTSVIIIGRMNTRGWSDLTLNVYYSYLYWAFLIPLVYSCVDFDAIKKTYLHFLKWVILIILSLITIYSGYRVYETNIQIAFLSKDSRQLVQAIEQLKQMHQGDKGFSFYVPDNYLGNYVVTWLNKRGDPPDKKYSFIEALYLDCFNRVTPRFSVN